MVIGEATQQGLLGEDFSVTNALLVITTFIVIDIGLDVLKERIPRLERVVEGNPVGRSLTLPFPQLRLGR